MTPIIRATAIEQDQDTFWAGAAEAATEMASATVNRNLRDAGGEDDITAGQKMMSAISGSLLTSLLGMLHTSRTFLCLLAMIVVCAVLLVLASPTPQVRIG